VKALGLIMMSLLFFTGKLSSQDMSTARSTITIKIEDIKQSYTPSDHKIIKIVLENRNDTAVFLNLERSRYSDYKLFRFELKRDGIEVQKTSFHLALIGEDSDPEVPESTGRMIWKLAPREISRIAINLDRLFDLSVPGNYSLSVKIPANLDLKNDLYSNPVQFQVLP